MLNVLWNVTAKIDPSSFQNTTTSHFSEAPFLLESAPPQNPPIFASPKKISQKRKQTHHRNQRRRRIRWSRRESGTLSDNDTGFRHPNGMNCLICCNCLDVSQAGRHPAFHPKKQTTKSLHVCAENGGQGGASVNEIVIFLVEGGRLSVVESVFEYWDDMFHFRMPFLEEVSFLKLFFSAEGFWE